MKRSPSGYPGTQAVQRAMTVLKAVARSGPDARLSDLTRQVGLNKSTVFRLLSALENAEMIERTAAREGYRVGRELVRMAGHALGKTELLAAARPTLQALAAETRETVTLEVLVGDEMLILDELMGGHVVGALPSLGTRWPAHATSTGKAVWASIPDQELALRLDRAMPAYTPRTVTLPAALRRELKRVRERGYATAVEELEPGFVAIGAAVRGALGDVVAAISVGGPRSRFGSVAIGAIAAKLPAHAQEISLRLGFRPDLPEPPEPARPPRSAPRRVMSRAP